MFFDALAYTNFNYKLLLNKPAKKWLFFFLGLDLGMTMVINDDWKSLE